MPKRIFDLMFNPGEVLELRAIGGLNGRNPAWVGSCYGAKGVVSGYFDNGSEFGNAALALDKACAEGVYFSMNPCTPALLARAANRLKANVNTTTDQDIAALRWLPLDLDPMRPSGISSTDDELRAAEALAKRITQFLEEEKNWPRAIRAQSGNGFHLLYRLPDLQNTPENVSLIQRMLEVLANRFRNERVQIDEKVFNPARIWKCYGTTARKGDHTPDRPHRMSKLLTEFTRLVEVGCVTLDQIQDIAREFHQSSCSQGISSVVPATQVKSREPGQMDVGSYLRDYNVGYVEKVPRDKPHLTLFVLTDGCPFNSNHRAGEAAIVRSPNKPYLTFQCFHQSCRGLTWREVRKLISGDDPIIKYYPGYGQTNQETSPLEPASEYCAVAAQVQTTYRIAFEGLIPRVPPPDQVDPLSFYETTPYKRGRPSFVPSYLANYLISFLGPLFYTMDAFWRYENGVYRRMEDGEIAHVAAVAMKDYARPNQYAAAVDLVSKLAYRKAADWPKQEKYINCKNGMLDPETGKLVSHSPDYLSRVQVPCEYNWDYLELSQPFLEFLSQAQPGKQNEQCIELLHRYGGYVLLPDNSMEKVLFLRGEGGNGKGTFINVITSVIGEHNVSALSLHDLGERFNTYRLITSMLNVSSEVNPRKSAQTDVLKQAVSGDIMKGEEKFGGLFEFRARTKFIFSINKRPLITDVGYALERRLIVVPFNVKLDGPNKNRKLKDELVEGHRRDGVFMWMLLGLEKILNEGFELPDNGPVRRATDALLQSLNPAMTFVSEICERNPVYKEGTIDLYKRYVRWCEATRHKVLSRNNFFETIESIPGVIRKAEGKDRRMRFVGIRINPDKLSSDEDGAPAVARYFRSEDEE